MPGAGNTSGSNASPTGQPQSSGNGKGNGNGSGNGAPDSAVAVAGTGTTGLAGTGGATMADPSQGFTAVRVFPTLNLPASQTSEIQLPVDTFEHSTQTDGFQLTATMADGSPLPHWVTFNSDKGTFNLEPPKGTSEKLDVRITAHDQQGRTATTGMVLNVH